MLRLYDYGESGNGYKVRMLLCRLGLAFEWVELDILQGQTRTPAFLAKNLNGRIPVLRLEDGTHLAESNAILWYLADGTPWLPDDRLARAQVLQWMFFEQYSHEPNIAVARFWHHLPAMSPSQRAQLPEKMDKGHAALAVMDQHLAKTPYFVGDRASIADLALYGYTHVAAEGGFDLAAYPAIRTWLDRISADPAHVAITDTVGAVAPNAA